MTQDTDSPEFPLLSMEMLANSGDYWKAYADKLFEKIDVLEKRNRDLYNALSHALYNGGLPADVAASVAGCLARNRPKVLPAGGGDTENQQGSDS